MLKKPGDKKRYWVKRHKTYLDHSLEESRSPFNAKKPGDKTRDLGQTPQTLILITPLRSLGPPSMLNARGYNKGFGSYTTNPIFDHSLEESCSPSMPKKPGDKTKVLGKTPQNLFFDHSH